MSAVIEGLGVQWRQRPILTLQDYRWLNTKLQAFRGCLSLRTSFSSVEYDRVLIHIRLRSFSSSKKGKYKITSHKKVFSYMMSPSHRSVFRCKKWNWLWLVPAGSATGIQLLPEYQWMLKEDCRVSFKSRVNFKGYMIELDCQENSEFFPQSWSTQISKYQTSKSLLQECQHF